MCAYNEEIMMTPRLADPKERISLEDFAELEQIYDKIMEIERRTYDLCIASDTQLRKGGYTIE